MATEAQNIVETVKAEHPEEFKEEAEALAAERAAEENASEQREPEPEAPAQGDPEDEQAPHEDEHLRRLQVLRHVRDNALTASRQMDVHRLGQAVHDLADLLHEMLGARH